MCIVAVFALSVICIFILGASIEGIRRVGRGYDRRIVRHSRETDYRFTKADTLYDRLYFIVRLVLDTPFGLLQGIPVLRVQAEPQTTVRPCIAFHSSTWSCIHGHVGDYVLQVSSKTILFPKKYLKTLTLTLQSAVLPSWRSSSVVELDTLSSAGISLLAAWLAIRKLGLRAASGTLNLSPC